MTHGALAQLVARYIRIVEVSGSNPLCSTMAHRHEPEMLILGEVFVLTHKTAAE